jgi:hypothetical protein
MKEECRKEQRQETKNGTNEQRKRLWKGRRQAIG